MLADMPSYRPNVVDIIAHPWVMGPFPEGDPGVATHEQVKYEMQNRYENMKLGSFKSLEDSNNKPSPSTSITTATSAGRMPAARRNVWGDKVYIADDEVASPELAEESKQLVRL